ncbi:LUD domain-containing protein [Streptomyces sp. NPDC000594]|uniref:LutC/YkgG family protein n=1 Tax=Streptomyces sp. NPDC000594 TaxID=3154261 RepID=UPI0033237CB1
MTGSARDRVLARIRAAVADAPPAPPPERDYRDSHTGGDPAALMDLLDRNLTEYRATVHRTDPAGLAALIGEILTGHGARTVVVPEGVPDGWLAATAAEPRHDGPRREGPRRPGGSAPLTAAELDACSAVLSGCALAIAETGTLVLDGGAAQGRRALTLVPDLHLCVVRAPGQIVPSVPRALPRLDPTRPLTWISGPSATSDIELDRVEGVHGPRRLEVILLLEE